MTDWELARKIGEGDEAAIREFIGAHHGSLLRFLRGLTGSREDAEDLAQQAFIRACLHIPAFEARASLKTWLHRIGFHEYTHWKRARKETSRLLDEPVLPANDFGAAVDRIVLNEAVGRLPAAQREALLLFDGAGLSLAEVAEELGVAVGTAKSRIHNARRRLRESLSAGTEGIVMEKPIEYRAGPSAEDKCADAVVIVRSAIARWKAALREGREPDRADLAAARMAFAGAFGEGPLSRDDARMGVELYHQLLDDPAACSALLDRYLRQTLDAEEEAWARSVRLGILCRQAEGHPNRVVEFVDRHREFIRWAETSLPSSRLLAIVSPPGPAVCWREAGLGAEWFEWLDEALALASADEAVRWERAVALRTAVTAARVLGDARRHAGYLTALARLADEDPAYERNAEILVEGWTLELLFAVDRGDKAIAASVAERAREAFRMHPSESLERKHRLGVAAGNLAAALMQAKAYPEAVEFGRLAVEWAPYYAHVFLRLAGSLRATGGSREEVLALIRRGGALRRGDDYDLRGMPEFADVRDDPEFTAAQRP